MQAEKNNQCAGWLVWGAPIPCYALPHEDAPSRLMQIKLKRTVGVSQATRVQPAIANVRRNVAARSAETAQQASFTAMFSQWRAMTIAIPSAGCRSGWGLHQKEASSWRGAPSVSGVTILWSQSVLRALTRNCCHAGLQSLHGTCHNPHGTIHMPHGTTKICVGLSDAGHLISESLALMITSLVTF